MQGYGMESDQRARNSVILRPFDSYGVVVQDSTEVRIDSANFIGPFDKKIIADSTKFTIFAVRIAVPDNSLRGGVE